MFMDYEGAGEDFCLSDSKDAQCGSHLPKQLFSNDDEMKEATCM